MIKNLGSGTALVAMALSMPAFAQKTAAATGMSSDDMIVVTARKRAEDI